MQARPPRIPSDLDGPGGAGPCPHSGVPAPSAKAGSPHLPFQSAPRSTSRYRVQKSAGTTTRAERHDIQAMLEYLLLLLRLLGSAVRDREALVAENLLLRHQLTVLARPTRKRPRLRARDKLFWVVVRALRRDWRRHLVVVRPESVIRWHRQAWQLFWRWRSRGPLGRPRLSAEVRELIATMAQENPCWGSERIRGELLKLGLVVSKRSIQRYRRRRGRAGSSPLPEPSLRTVS